MLLLNCCIRNRDNLILILIFLIMQMGLITARTFEEPTSQRETASESKKNKTTCDEARMQCDRLYTQLSTVEEDCKTYRIYLGCLGMLKGSQTSCNADFHYWMMLSTTEKLIMEKCSPGDTSPIEPPREIFHYPISPKYSKASKIYSLPPCLDSLNPPAHSKHQYHSCALFGHPNLIPYSGERQTCRLRGAWPLVNNRYISVQISGKSYSQFHFHDLSASAVTQISVILKPDLKCLGDLAVPTLIYVASSTLRLSVLFMNNRREMHQSMISIRSIIATESHEKVELWFGYINTRIFISRTLVAQDEYSLSVSVLLPSQVAMVKPRSKQHSLVRELCSLGCPPPESVDDITLLSKYKPQEPQTNPSEACRHGGLNGAFFDVCYLMSLLAAFTNRAPSSTKSINNYISISTKHIQNNMIEFSKIISENFTIDLNPRSTFQPFRPVWKIRELDRQYRQPKGSSTTYQNLKVVLFFPLVILSMVSKL